MSLCINFSLGCWKFVVRQPFGNVNSLEFKSLVYMHAAISAGSALPIGFRLPSTVLSYAVAIVRSKQNSPGIHTHDVSRHNCT